MELPLVLEAVLFFVRSDIFFSMQLNSEYQYLQFSHEYFYDKDEPLS